MHDFPELPTDHSRDELFERVRPPAHPYASKPRFERPITPSSTSSELSQPARRPQTAFARRPQTVAAPNAPVRPPREAYLSRGAARAHADDDNESELSRRSTELSLGGRSSSLSSGARGLRSVVDGSLVFRDDDPPEIWQNKLEELKLRVELEKLRTRPRDLPAPAFTLPPRFHSPARG